MLDCGQTADLTAWIDTYSGREINLFNPDPASIRLEDIAHTLAMQCRFNGHCRYHYSIAQHSLLVASLCPLEHWLCGAMHDSSEAFLCDLPGPVKHSGLFPWYSKIEHNLMSVIADVFSFAWPMPPEVKWADDVMLWIEADALMHKKFGRNQVRPDLSGIKSLPKIEPMSPLEAEKAFLKAYMEHVFSRPEVVRTASDRNHRQDAVLAYSQTQGLQVQLNPQEQF